MCLGKAEQGAVNKQWPPSSPTCASSPYGCVCVPLVHVFPACPVYAVPMCVSEDGSPGLQGRF